MNTIIGSVGTDERDLKFLEDLVRREHMFDFDSQSPPQGGNTEYLLLQLPHAIDLDYNPLLGCEGAYFRKKSLTNFVKTIDIRFLRCYSIIRK